MVQDIVERSALLLALIQSAEHGISLSILQKAIPSYNNALKHLSQIGFKVEIDNTMAFLRTPTSFTLYQSIPPEIRNEVEEILWSIVSKPELINGEDLMYRVVQPRFDQFPESFPQSGKPVFESNSKAVWLVSGDERFPLACIHCYEPPCQTYGISAFGTTDAFASEVCPSLAVAISPKDGSVQLDQSKCAGCMLCIIRCPIASIQLADGIAQKREYVEVPSWKSYVDEKIATIKEKREITRDILMNLPTVPPQHKFNIPLVEILDNFDHKVSQDGQNWDLNPYYTWVRNCFRELGLDALYTGSAGKLKRADVTIRGPFFVGVEVKSPAEGNITVAALRQAIDAAVEVGKTYGVKATPAVVGQGVNRGVHAKAVDYHNSLKINIPLIGGRFLLYLLLSHYMKLPQSPMHDIRRLFCDYHGWIGQKEIDDYFTKYFELRKNNIEDIQQEVPLPESVKLALQVGKPDKAYVALENIERATIDEVAAVFTGPERTPRGRYSKP